MKRKTKVGLLGIVRKTIKNYQKGKEMNKFMKRTTIGSVMRGICYGFAALLFAASCANDDVAQDEKQKKNNIPAGTTVFTGTSQPDATTRTAILNHTKGAGASVNWSSNDKIWVKDDAGTWQQSGAVSLPSALNKTEGSFALSGTYTGISHNVVYTNKPFSGTQAQVEIKATQVQSVPNNFDHAGESGDCGIATSNKVNGTYKFTLNHKAAYLCFIPRSSNSYVNRSKLIKVEIMCDDDIAGTYNMANDGSLTLVSGGSKTITITAGSGFAIDNSVDDMSKNATYAVVAPGTHKFRIRYWLRNTTDNPDGPIEGTVSKYVTVNCIAGSIQDITANLDPYDYDGDHYYMWDAQQQYWYGYEWTRKLTTGQPTNSNDPHSENYPKGNTDSRWHNEGTGVGRYDATTALFKTLPNVNEMSWYVQKGDSHYDSDELWTTMGHLYKGGMWFLKKNNISGYSTEKSYDGTDWRVSSPGYNANHNIVASLPSIGDTGKFFYMPFGGEYYMGRLTLVGSVGKYWSSSAERGFAYNIGLKPNFVEISSLIRTHGYSVRVFE